MTKMFGPNDFGQGENKPTIMMFSGQGSQYYQMGRDLYDNHDGFHRHLNDLDSLVKEQLGESVISHMYDNQNRITDPFDRLLYTHPAIFILEIALSRVLADVNIKPDIVMGASLGEFGAAYIAGAISIEQCIQLLLAQAKIVESKCRGAGMLAILASEFSYSDTPEICEHSELASINAEGHFVVSGINPSLQKIEKFLTRKSIGFLRLPVKFGFHSSLIDDVKSDIEAALNGITWLKPRIPFVSCTTAGFKKAFEENYFWQVARQPIRLSETIQLQEYKGNYNYVDVGASGMMANAVKNNLKKGSRSQVFSVLSPFGGNIKKLEKTQSALIKNKFIETKDLTMKVVVFPGQGSQKKGMGADLFDEFPEYEQTADAVLGYSIRSLCLEDPNRELNKTQFTQPALFVVNALSYLKIIKDGNKKPDRLMGHSLGEFNALFAAGVFDFETGLKLVKIRGELMSKAKDGGMAAVMGCDVEKVISLLKENNFDSIDVANFNSPEQTVLSGPRDDILKAAPFFERGDAMYFPLNVSAAFHSRYMEKVKDEFGRYLDELDLKSPEIPVVSNVTAQPYEFESIRDNLKQQITSSVRWTESVQNLIGEGYSEFEEIGPGDVLTKLITTIKKHTPKPEIIVKSDSVGQEEIQKVEVEGIPETEVGAKVETAEAETETEASMRQEEQFYETSDTHTETPSSTAIQTDKTHGYVMPEALGSASFKRDYNLRYAYLSGSMYKAISSKELVVKMGQAGYLSFLGTGGVAHDEVEQHLRFIKDKLFRGEPFGANLLANLQSPESEFELVKMFMSLGVKYVEASAFMQISPALVYYRLHSLERDQQGVVRSRNKLIAKLSRPEVANVFLRPAPERIVHRLLEENLISAEQAEMSKEVSVADDICVESDSGGHTDMGVIATLLPSIMRLRDEICEEMGYVQDVRVGAAGGIGTPESAASVFLMGADFIVTGSINQCTIEAGTSDQVKNLLQQINVQDTTYAPAGDMFELGAKVQVMKKGLFFPARANKLYDLWRHCDSIEEIDATTRKQLEDKYFKRSLEDVWTETVNYYNKVAPSEIEKAEANPKQKMAMIFRWYFVQSTRLALNGEEKQRVDYQVHCGPALGAFNQWVKGTELESWKNRHVDQIADKLMSATADFINSRLALYMN